MQLVEAGKIDFEYTGMFHHEIVCPPERLAALAKAADLRTNFRIIRGTPEDLREYENSVTGYINLSYGMATIQINDEIVVRYLRMIRSSEKLEHFVRVVDLNLKLRLLELIGEEKEHQMFEGVMHWLRLPILGPLTVTEEDHPYLMSMSDLNPVKHYRSRRRAKTFLDKNALLEIRD